MMLTAPVLQALRCRCRRVNSLFEDPGSALKGGVKVWKRPLVKEVLGLLLTEFFPKSDPQGRDTYTAWAAFSFASSLGCQTHQT